MFIKKLCKRLLSLLGVIPGEIYVFLVAFIYRLPTLGYDFINNDAFLWKERGYSFGAALTSLNFAGTAVTYHPGVPLLWCQFIAIKIYSTLLKLGVLTFTDSKNEFFVNNQIQTTVVVFLTSILLAIVYKQLKRIVGFKLAFLTTLLILIEPFYLAMSRALHTDTMMSLFMFVSVLYFYNYLLSDNKKLLVSDGIFAGIFTGLAFLTKSSALFLIPFFLLIAGIYFLKTRNFRVINKTLIVLGFSIVAFFAFWPAMWVQPIESLNLYIFKGVQGVALEEGHDQFWFGKETADPGPLFYPVVLVGRYSPLLIFTLLASIYFFFKNRNIFYKDKTIGFIGGLFLYFFFYMLMIIIVSKKLDRYSLPVVFPLAVFGAWVISKLRNKKLLLALLAILLIIRGYIFYEVHPNYLAYYSPLIGGIDGGRYVVEPKWLVGYDEVAKYFNEKQKMSDTQIKVAIADYVYLDPFADFKVLNIQHETERDDANYFVLPVYRPDRNLFYTTNYNLQKPEAVIKIAGVDYYYIYKVK